jgi:hypothetical protein
VKRILKPAAYVLAVLYFLLDAVFLPVAGRMSRWVGDHWALGGLRRWIESLPPYPTLLLFAVPVVVLEPVKPLAFYLVGTGHVVTGLSAFVVAELVKLVLIERLFNISRDKLMSIAAFAWGYGKYRQARDWATSLEAWQNLRRLSRVAQYAVRRHVREWRASQHNRRLSTQSR